MKPKFEQNMKPENEIPLADVQLKTDKIGNSITVRKVSPAELMFLVADNHMAAGGNPVVKINYRYKKVPGEVPMLDPIGLPVVDDKGEKVMIEGLVDSDEPETINLTPKQEYNRLLPKFGARFAKLFPGGVPNLPRTFEEAQEAGLGTQTTAERLLTVGG